MVRYLFEKVVVVAQEPSALFDIFQVITKIEKEQVIEAYTDTFKKMLKNEDELLGRIHELQDKLNNTDMILKKNDMIIRTQDAWMRLTRNRMSLCNLFLSQDIHKIVIYGYGKLGIQLNEELSGSKVPIEVIIDAKKEDPKIFKIDQIDNIEADAIIICAYDEWWITKRILEKKYRKKAYTLLQIFEM